ncbi:MAG: hypothetical protein Q9187_009183 [Circinaria calcarea]
MARHEQFREAYQGIANAMPPVIPLPRLSPARARRDLAARGMATLGRVYEGAGPVRTTPNRAAPVGMILSAAAEELDRIGQEIPTLRRANTRQRPTNRRTRHDFAPLPQLVPPQREHTIQHPIGPLTGYPYDMDVFARDPFDGYGNENRNGQDDRNVGEMNGPGVQPQPPYMGLGQPPGPGSEGWGDYVDYW